LHTLWAVPGPDDGIEDQLALASDALELLIRRLRSLSDRAWSTRREPALVLLRQLAALGSAVEDVGPHEVPDLPDYALADAVALVGGDLLEAASLRGDRAALERALAELRAAWAATR
jgi:hypothetical protein